MSSTFNNLMVSVSPRDVINHLDFLKSIEAQDDRLYDDTYIQNSIRRYEKFWLPLIATIIAETPEDERLYAPPLGNFKFCII